ncbi:UDP-2,4-diacetamido-2,4,6-trideoxy-beta-L-altropyranose hydrolase [Shewanella sp. FJAT-52076]|uniref:UDP-2,4-diacetamido-2,4, 6-trideoxy-beta-L-altropyranose hydrolase n=1 Tax=Shewanella sp. FJAT-52076 TaxID=2864202 RepID=UPI001C65EBF1|nr:UDP-2,4-diacetamido-2,4,6-trideoxy-beta-L-altropyranose hydrolase [Shewanella sp. FJAT-52076]QYJ74124.1 UDP-2,4-diacetamido-2,4,6-trideoxy-beta-L-altropyranose hydrolase [Shewanella sp. FJAT-52076]
MSMEAFLPAEFSTLVFYANASATIGSGHLMRLMALADAFNVAAITAKVTPRIVFWSKTCPDSLKQKLYGRGFDWQAAPPTLTSSAVDALDADILVVDDYHLDANEWQALSGCRAFCLALDDAIASHQLAVDAVLNPAPDLSETSYRLRAKRASLFLGPRYTLLRQEFRDTPIPNFEARHTLLITLGGSDVKHLSLPLVYALSTALPETPITIVVGAMTPLNDAVLMAANRGNQPLRVLRNVENMAEVMADCGLAVSAAGGTLGELAAMGVPTFALVCVDNQSPALTSSLVDSWYRVIDMRTWQPETTQASASESQKLLDEVTERVKQLWHNPCKREMMSQKARQIVDSSGIIELASLLLRDCQKTK